MGERPTTDDLRDRLREGAPPRTLRDGERSAGPPADLDHPRVEDARKLGKRDGLRRCIVLFETEDGYLGYASYGETKRLCDETKEIADLLYEGLGYEIQNRE